jgi:hypothetical protein
MAAAFPFFAPAFSPNDSTFAGYYLGYALTFSFENGYSTRSTGLSASGIDTGAMGTVRSGYALDYSLEALEHTPMTPMRSTTVPSHVWSV